MYIATLREAELHDMRNTAVLRQLRVAKSRMSACPGLRVAKTSPNQDPVYAASCPMTFCRPGVVAAGTLADTGKLRLDRCLADLSWHGLPNSTLVTDSFHNN